MGNGVEDNSNSNSDSRSTLLALLVCEVLPLCDLCNSLETKRSLSSEYLDSKFHNIANALSSPVNNSKIPNLKIFRGDHQTSNGATCNKYHLLSEFLSCTKSHHSCQHCIIQPVTPSRINPLASRHHPLSIKKLNTLRNSTSLFTPDFFPSLHAQFVKAKASLGFRYGIEVAGKDVLGMVG